MSRSPSARLQALIHRPDKVLAVLHPPTASHARIMQRAGCGGIFYGVWVGSHVTPDLYLTRIQ